MICWSEKKTHKRKEPLVYPFLWQDGWQELHHQGIVNERVIKCVWKEFEAEEQQQLLDIMKQFDLICDAPSDAGTVEKANTNRMESDTSPFPEEKYFVPSMFLPKRFKEELIPMASLVFYVDFRGMFTGADFKKIFLIRHRGCLQVLTFFKVLIQQKYYALAVEWTTSNKYDNIIV